MGQKTRTFLKKQNRDFNNVLDSFSSLADYKTITSAAAMTDYSGLYASNWTININAPMADDNALRLPESTVANGGMNIKVVFSIAVLDAFFVGFKTTNILGGASATGDTNEAAAAANATAFADIGDTFKRVEFDLDTEAKCGGTGGTVLNFYYPGIANVVNYRGDIMSEIDAPTLATHFTTTLIDA